MMKMSLRPLPERISITLRTGRGGDEANEGWFFLSPDEWERFKVKLGERDRDDPDGRAQELARHRRVLSG